MAAPPLACDILIAGASAGGVAAALAAAASGAFVCLLEETEWVGGQLTAQGVSTPDEQQYIETFGGTRRYGAFRKAVRRRYQEGYILSESAKEAPYFNPGNCWVSKLSYEPKVGEAVLREMLQPWEESGRLRLFFRTHVRSLRMDTENENRIAEVFAHQTDQEGNEEELRFAPRIALDATDTGDLLPLCGAETRDWVIGAEGIEDTDEPDAPSMARPDWVQPFTFPLALEWSPDTCDTNLIEPPHDYDELKAQQRYHIKHGAITGLFTGRAPWWSYRRILASENFDDPRIPRDVAMINTAGNDYYGGNILGANAGTSEQQGETLARARRASLGYLYWLQTECPRESEKPEEEERTESVSGKGYPEFRLRKDLFDTEDGCSVRPYIRESRRIRSLRPILEQEIVVRDFSGRLCRGDNARAVFMADSVGIGHYALDIHPNGHGEPNHYVATRPFQIPLGALIPVRMENLLPACKNLGTTHLTNGAYRLHPIEWNIGESAGLLAAHAIQTERDPREIYLSTELRAAFQRRLLEEGIALHWYRDVPPEHSAFIPVQTLASYGQPLGAETDLLFRPDEPVSEETWKQWLTLTGKVAPAKFHGTRAEATIVLGS